MKRYPSDAALRSGAPRREKPGRTKRLCVLLPVHWSALMGGAQYQAKLLIERLLERYDVEIHYLTVRCNPEHRPEGYALHRFSSRTGIRRYGFFFDAVRLYGSLRKLRPDIIYQQVGCAHTGIAAYYAKRNDALMAWRVSSDRSVTAKRVPWWKLHRRIERAFLEHGIRNAHVVLAQTASQQAALAERYGRRDAFVIPNFHRGVPPPKEHGGRRNVLWIANLKRVKNPHAFVRLAASFGSGAGVRFVMIGAAMQDDPWTQDLLRAIGSVSSLDYLGGRSQEEVDDALRQARVLVNTSDHEGFSNTFIQAWMREVPVISLRVDPDRLLSEHGLGLLSRSEEQLRRDVQRLLEDDRLAAEIGARCREHALRHHSLENVDRVAALMGLAEKASGSPSRDRAEGSIPAEAAISRAGRSGVPMPHGGLPHAPDSPLRQ